MAKFTSNSRYRTTDMIIVGGAETLGAWNQPSYLLERPGDDFIASFAVNNTVEGRPDLIANEIYGTPLLDWVIIAFNAPTELLNWPTAGTTIEYPMKELVLAEL